MSTLNPAVAPIEKALAFFDKTTSCLTEEDSAFRPQPEMYSVAEQVAHTAQTIDWFVEGAFGPAGFDMDFAAHDAKVRTVRSLTEARAWLARAGRGAIEAVGSKTDEDLATPLPAAGIMGGLPKRSILSGIAEHTAHHRGSLAVYVRLLGKTPPMPYA